VNTGPLGWNPGNIAGTLPLNPDENHVSFGGRNFVRIPCPPPPVSQAQAAPANNCLFGFLCLKTNDSGERYPGSDNR
jgi:hypothetical protein